MSITPAAIQSLVSENVSSDDALINNLIKMSIQESTTPEGIDPVALRKDIHNKMMNLEGLYYGLVSLTT